MSGVAKTEKEITNGVICRLLICSFIICPYSKATRYPGGRWCPQSEFQCANRLCVSQSWVCDGVDDCGDRSDEQLTLCCEKYFLHFIYNKPCEKVFSLYFLMVLTHTCVVYVTVNVTCELPFRFRCANGYCLYSGLMCNQKDDCGDGSDEKEELCMTHAHHIQSHTSIQSSSGQFGMETLPLTNCDCFFLFPL